jgi:hypothetical protein
MPKSVMDLTVRGNFHADEQTSPPDNLGTSQLPGLAANGLGSKGRRPRRPEAAIDFRTVTRG